MRRKSKYIELRALWEVNCARVRGHRGHFSAWRLYFIATLKRPYFLSFSPTVRVCVCAHIIDQGLVCLIRSIDSNMADLGLHITLLPISRQALPSSAATCQNQLLVLQIGLCLFLYVFPVFEHLSVLFCSVLLFLAREARIGETQIPFGGSRSHCAAAQPAADRHQLNTPRAAAAA